MSRSKDYRLSKEKLHKTAVKRRLKESDSNTSSASVGIRARTKANCSCWMCGNPRNHNGNSESSKTIQELREQCVDINKEIHHDE